MNGETTMSAEPQRKTPPEFDPAGAAVPAPGAQHGIVDLPRPFRLDSGAILADARIAWHCDGPADAPLVVALGGISAHRRAGASDGKGWWEAQAGPGRTLDTSRYRVLGIDWLGGCNESTGPRSSQAKQGQEFPVVSTADQARALLVVLNRLGVRRVHLLVGASYGGNVAQQLAALLGERLRRLVLLSAAHRPAQFGLALRHIQRSILDIGADGDQALALARELAVLCYRSTEGVERRFNDDASRGGVVGWLRHHGDSFSRRFDTAAYRCLGHSLDGHYIDPATIRVPTTVFAVREDLTVPLSLLHEYVARAGGPCELVEISSAHGHDAFLKEDAAVTRVLTAALEATP
jgi:homoserine O-acetyltransferase/O-succinyltransferase